MAKERNRQQRVAEDKAQEQLRESRETDVGKIDTCKWCQSFKDECSCATLWHSNMLTL